MNKEAPYDFDAALAKIYAVANCRTQMDLAAFFEVRQSSISDAQRRRRIPANWLLALLRRAHVNPDWILYGSQPQYLFADGAKPEELPPHAGLRTITTRDLVWELAYRIVPEKVAQAPDPR